MLITAAPRGQSLEVTLGNPARGAFSGKLMVRADGENSDGPAVQIGKGQDQAHLRFPLQTGFHQVLLVDGQERGDGCVAERLAVFSGVSAMQPSSPSGFRSSFLPSGTPIF
ncbi:MAG: hypothetical protein ABSE84_14710 [Isosphaeraceae bacterium]